jgi:hypothetical protein
MTETIIIAVLSFAGTLSGAFFANRKSSALIAYRMEQLEKEVKKHNDFATKIPVMEEKINVANHRIDDLEKGA